MPELSNKPVYTIGVASELLGLSTHSLRLYEREGLILPHRTKTNRRLYSDVELGKAANIHNMIQEKGLNFAAIRNLLALIPCWKICCYKCVKCEHWSTFFDCDKPCWTKAERCRKEQELCRDCPVYLESTDLIKIKHMIYPTGLEVDSKP